MEHREYQTIGHNMPNNGNNSSGLWPLILVEQLFEAMLLLMSDSIASKS